MPDCNHCHCEPVCVYKRNKKNLEMHDCPYYCSFDSTLLPPPNSKEIVTCPTCGMKCTIGGDDEEGTHYYIPCRIKEKKIHCVYPKACGMRANGACMLSEPCEKFKGD